MEKRIALECGNLDKAEVNLGNNLRTLFVKLQL